jgi:hypothetical protein
MSGTKKNKRRKTCILITGNMWMEKECSWLNGEQRFVTAKRQSTAYKTREYDYSAAPCVLA